MSSSGNGHDDDSKRPKSQRKRQRTVIISALAAGGVFQLNGWQVQAHGNRSTESASAFQNMTFSPTDYVLMRQSLTAPNAAATHQLAQVTEQLRALTKSHPGAIDSADFKKLLEIKGELEARLQLRPSTNQSLKFLRAGDAAAAVAAIEGEGWAERVLTEYSWALLDIANLGRQGEVFTAGSLTDFVAIAKPAMAYSAKVLAGLPANASGKDAILKERVAEVLNNVASFTVPDVGSGTSESLKLGRDAAERALALREELGSLPEIMRAHIWVGVHAERAGDIKTAEQQLREAASMATQLHDLSGVAWANTYLAEALQRSNPAAAQAAHKAALQAADAVKGPDVTIDFLRAYHKLAKR